MAKAGDTRVTEPEVIVARNASSVTQPEIVGGCGFPRAAKRCRACWGAASIHSSVGALTGFHARLCQLWQSDMHLQSDLWASHKNKKMPVRLS